MTTPPDGRVCGCGAVLTSEAKWSRHIADGCQFAGLPHVGPERCPHCAGPRVPTDAGPGYVAWLCESCGRVGREEVVPS